MFSRFYADESGATAIEYALIASIVSVVVVGALVIIGGALTGSLSTVAGAL